MGVKLCIDCKWWDGDITNPRCTRKSGKFNLATGGEQAMPLIYCENIRKLGFVERWPVYGGKMCGKSAPFFEPKEPK